MDSLARRTRLVCVARDAALRTHPAREERKYEYILEAAGLTDIIRTNQLSGIELWYFGRRVVCRHLPDAAIFRNDILRTIVWGRESSGIET
jgi:hypothetical protein